MRNLFKIYLFILFITFTFTFFYSIQDDLYLSINGRKFNHTNNTLIWGKTNDSNDSLEFGRIPKKIHFHSDYGLKKLERMDDYSRNIMEWSRMFPFYQIKYYDQHDAEKFIKKHFENPKILQTYKRYTKDIMRFDFFRFFFFNIYFSFYLFKIFITLRRRRYLRGFRYFTNLQH